MIFNRLGWKENKHLFGLLYGAAYAVFGFILIEVFRLILGQAIVFSRDFMYCAGIGVAMYVMYLVKWEFFKGTAILKKK